MYCSRVQVTTQMGTNMNRQEWWLSCNKFTVWVETTISENGREKITNTAPVIYPFIGQPFDNLKLWFRKFGNFKYHKL